MAHRGQYRKTGEPYVVHCIHTALIVERLLSRTETEDRKTLAVIVAILHDVVDDTPYRLEHLEQAFGKQVAVKVDKVTKISQMNQLMRRLERTQGKEMTRETLDEMRNLILGMVDDPLILLVKLADRLHNMRTVFALRAEKRGPVAKETLHVWCPLAERLGLFPLKGELEDLCFAVLQPARYVGIRRELDSLWGLHYSSQLPPHSELPQPAVGLPALWEECESQSEVPDGAMFEMDDPAVDATGSFDEIPNASALSAEQMAAKALLATVMPFYETRFSTEGSECLGGCSGEDRGLQVLVRAARDLHRELAMGGHVAVLTVKVQGRLKSLYSIHRKMRRKGLKSVADVCDARALRVIVDDEERSQLHCAITSCYRLNDVVERLWKPIYTEADDYIANPKRSGYQSLHTAVRDRHGVLFEVQIRTESMHRDAEYGSASHWVYKETVAPCAPGFEEKHVVEAGQPVWRISDSGIQDGVVVQAVNNGRQLLVASTNNKRFFTDTMCATPAEYRAIQQHVEERGYFAPGQGDLQVYLEAYILCQDGKYHRVDHCGHKHTGTTVVPLFRLTAHFAQSASPTTPLLQYSSSGASSSSGAGSFPAGPAVGLRMPVGSAPLPSRAVAGVEQLPCSYPWSLTSTGSFDMPYDEALGLSSPCMHLAGSLPPSRRNHSSRPSQGAVLHTTTTVKAATPPPQLAASSSRAAAAQLDAPKPVPAASLGEAGGKDNAAEDKSAELAAHTARVNLLRTALEARVGPGVGGPPAALARGQQVALQLPGEKVLVMVWPTGEVRKLERGTTAGHIIKTQGEIMIDAGGKARRRRTDLVNVNNRLVPESTPLKTGDYVVLSRDILDI